MQHNLSQSAVFTQRRPTVEWELKAEVIPDYFSLKKLSIPSHHKAEYYVEELCPAHCTQSQGKMFTLAGCHFSALLNYLTLAAVSASIGNRQNTKFCQGWCWDFSLAGLFPEMESCVCSKCSITWEDEGERYCLASWNFRIRFCLSGPSGYRGNFFRLHLFSCCPGQS